MYKTFMHLHIPNNTLLLLSFFIVTFEIFQTVKEEDLVEEDPYDTVKTDSNSEDNDDDIETGSMEDCGQLKLGNGTLNVRKESKVTWAGSNAFNLGALSLR
ncbi:MAG: hypothetical protein SGARI_004547 [Bacillariaceae sp.]